MFPAQLEMESLSLFFFFTFKSVDSSTSDAEILENTTLAQLHNWPATEEVPCKLLQLLLQRKVGESKFVQRIVNKKAKKFLLPA